MAQQPSNEIVIGATEARSHFGTLLNRVYRNQERLLIEKSGIPIAAIISMKEYEEFRRFQAAQETPTPQPEPSPSPARPRAAEAQRGWEMEDDRNAVLQGHYGRNR